MTLLGRHHDAPGWTIRRRSACWSGSEELTPSGKVCRKVRRCSGRGGLGFVEEVGKVGHLVVVEQVGVDLGGDRRVGVAGDAGDVDELAASRQKRRDERVPQAVEVTSGRSVVRLRRFCAGRPWQVPERGPGQHGASRGHGPGWACAGASRRHPCWARRGRRRGCPRW